MRITQIIDPKKSPKNASRDPDFPSKYEHRIALIPPEIAKNTTVGNDKLMN
jgi:hypothetical protein